MADGFALFHDLPDQNPHWQNWSVKRRHVRDWLPHTHTHTHTSAGTQGFIRLVRTRGNVATTTLVPCFTAALRHCTKVLYKCNSQVIALCRTPLESVLHPLLHNVSQLVVCVACALANTIPIDDRVMQLCIYGIWHSTWSLCYLLKYIIVMFSPTLNVCDYLLLTTNHTVLTGMMTYRFVFTVKYLFFLYTLWTVCQLSGTWL